jgi:hypothetical protein
MRTFDSELRREANIAQNRVLLKELGIKEAITNLGSSSGKLSDRNAAKPVQPTKRIKRERDSESELPRRQSRRLLTKSQSKHETLTPEESVCDYLIRCALSILYSRRSVKGCWPKKRRKDY